MHTKTRSDYHDLQDTHPISVFHYAHWLKPVLLVSVGFILGMMYNKQAPVDMNKAILMSEQTTTNKPILMSEQTKTAAPVVKKNQTAKGAVISSKA